MAELLILREGDRSGRYNMARDLALADLVRSDGQPRLRLYGWSRPTLSLGYGQNPDAFSPDLLGEMGVDLVRRPTGGKAVLHQDEVTYAFIVPTEDLPGDVRSTYLEIARPLLAALRSLGADVGLAGDPGQPGRDENCFQQPSWYEIEAGGRKLLGSAQVRHLGVLLQHGALPLSLDYGLWARIFAPRDPERYAEAMRRRATDLGQATGREPSRREVRDALVRAFSAWWAGRSKEVSDIAR